MATTEKLDLPLIEPNMTADVPRDMNALAEAVDAKVGVAGGLAVLGADGKVPADQLNVKDPVDASLTQKGIVQLSEATNSTSNTMAATPSAVKKAYDLAASKMAPYPDSIEMRQTATSPGPAFIDFHSSGTGNDYDSRIIAEGGTSAAGNGKITVQAATTALTGKVVTDGQVWVAKKSAFGDNSGLSLPIGDSDTGFNWVSDGYVEFYSNAIVPVALKDGQFIFKNTAGGYEVLSTAINDLKQSVVNGKGVVAGAINGKGGNVTASNTFPELAAAITNLPVKRFASGTFNGQSATATSSAVGVNMTVAVALPFTVTRVFIRVVLADTQGTSTSRQVDGVVMTSNVFGDNQGAMGWRNNAVSIGYLEPPIQGFSVKLSGSRIDAYAGGSPIAKISAYEWWAYE
ncbi:tail fiber protein [Paenibacillus terrae]|uniref:tail fiber protein n=1 Tax=Paenibacillus terrae TaxID=159743 RepID=UPI0011EAB541|nr:phage tail protein [Paenibacillus terrae]